MIANYGFEDGTGTYYISIDENKCEDCLNRQCLSVCPGQIFRTEENDWGDEIVCVKAELRHQLNSLCAECKRGGQKAPPCVAACSHQAIAHTW